MRDDDYDPYLDAVEDTAQVEMDQEQADLDGEADRFEYYLGDGVLNDGVLGNGTLLLIEQPNGSFVGVRTAGFRGVH